MNGSFALALLTGMVVTLNPCGFAMLPAYLSAFLGRQTTAEEQRSPVAGIARALRVSGAVSLGFMLVFLVIGTLVRLGAHALLDVARPLTLLVGLLLVVAGVAMLLGHPLPVFTPKLEKGGKDNSFGSMLVFGISYAVASLGCSLSLFIGYTIGTARTNGIASAVVSFLLYGLGFALVLTSLTISLALAQGGFLRGLRRAMQYIDRLSALFMIVAGLYLAWYGYTEIRGTGNSVTLKATGWSGQMQTWIQDQGAVRLAAILGILVALAVAAVLYSRQRTPES